jgi:hypothetical protein
LTWRAKISVGVPLGLLFMTLVVVLDAWLLDRLINEGIRSQQINLLSFLMLLVVVISVPLLVLLGFQTLGCLTLRYRLDRNGLAIRWLGYQEVIPIRDFQRIVLGYQLGGTIVRRRGVRWPGHERGVGMVPGIGRTRFLATRPLRDQLILVATGEAYGISPHDVEGFVRAVDARRELGPNRLLDRGVVQARLLEWPLWTDQTAWLLLGLAVFINLALFGYLGARFPRLDLQLPLHFNNQGLVDRIGTRMELFTLPIIGLIILGTNTVLGLALYRYERAGSYLLWGASTATQALFWLAVFSIGP